jgi:NADH dehydrogenase [ubiquinone] 1 alpha subcomplex assembly factor 5
MLTANRQLPSAIFDHKRALLHKARAAKDFAAHDFLFREMEERLQERILEIKREFARKLEISGRPDQLNVEFLESEVLQDPRLRGDVEYDLITSAGGLHWVNDLPGVLSQICRALAPDGCFLAILPGGETLKELRVSLEQAELAVRGGISPRVSPFIDVRDAGSLLQRAGFALPVVDSEIITVEYDHPLKLLADLRGMGETNALVSSVKHFTPRHVMMAAMEHYQKHFSNEAGRVLATIELVTLTGWKPHESQQKPARRGGGNIYLGDVLRPEN